MIEAVVPKRYSWNFPSTIAFPTTSGLN